MGHECTGERMDALMWKGRWSGFWSGDSCYNRRRFRRRRTTQHRLCRISSHLAIYEDSGIQCVGEQPDCNAEGDSCYNLHRFQRRWTRHRLCRTSNLAIYEDSGIRSVGEQPDCCIAEGTRVPVTLGTREERQG